ncbi:MAG: hypothetical protein K2F53_00035, partial [Rikenellaceae bacterium]|nr:hypothetical protein [Rikenellaceae bacterium]
MIKIGFANLFQGRSGFAAVGYRFPDGSLNYAGTWGGYWSSVAYSYSHAYSLYFGSGDLYVRHS